MSSDFEVRPRSKHRTFTAADKARILAEYQAASSPIERAAMMRQEGVYSSLVCNWRKQRLGTEPKKRGRPADPGDARIAERTIRSTRSADGGSMRRPRHSASTAATRPSWLRGAITTR